MAKKDNLALAMRIRVAREAKQLTQEQLAKLIGASQQSVQSWEVGRQTPRGLVRCHRLSEVLGIDIKELASGDSPALAMPDHTSCCVDADGYEMHERLVFEEQTEPKLREALPAHLRGNVGVQLTYKGISYPFSYFSDKSLISVFEPKEVIGGIITSALPRMQIYKELLAHKILARESRHQIHYAVICVYTGSSGVRLPATIINEAVVAGVNLDVVYSYDDAAKRIAEYELLPVETN